MIYSFEIGGVELEVYVWGEYTKKEPVGTNHPGFQAFFEYWGCEVQTITGETYEYNRNQRPDWFYVLDEIADKYLTANLEETESNLLDAYNG